MYATVMSFAVRFVAIFVLLNIHKLRDLVRQWYEDMLEPKVAAPRFNLDSRCQSENTADADAQLPTAEVPGGSGEPAESTHVDFPGIAAYLPPRFYVGPTMVTTWRPPAPSVETLVAEDFGFPPPPPPEYYVVPAWFDIFGPPPQACCVAASMFSYPPPPLPAMIRIRK